jgi:ABC-type Mn2+/Zn2+ transport system permease subunit
MVKATVASIDFVGAVLVAAFLSPPVCEAFSVHDPRHRLWTTMGLAALVLLANIGSRYNR